MRLVFHLSEIYGLQVNATDAAVVRGPVVETHLFLIGSRSELGSTLHSLRSFSFLELASDRDIKVVQDVESLLY